MIRKFCTAAALFAVLAVTTSARASTVEFVNLNFGDGFTASGTISFSGPFGPPPQFFFPFPVNLSLSFNGTPLPSLSIDTGLGNPFGGVDPVFFDGCGIVQPCPFVNETLLEALSWPIDHIPTNFADFTLGNSENRGDGIPAISGDVSIVPLPAALPLFGSGVVALAGLAWRRRGKVSS